jgi:hypothetical protein
MVDFIFCDLGMAFDSVTSEILSELMYYGMIDKAKLSFVSYLKVWYKGVQITILILIDIHFLIGPN